MLIDSYHSVAHIDCSWSIAADGRCRSSTTNNLIESKRTCTRVAGATKYGTCIYVVSLSPRCSGL